MVKTLGDQDLIIKRNNKGIPNGWVVPLGVNGKDSFKSELGMDAGSHYSVEEELTSREGVPKIRRGKRLEAARKKQSCEVDDLVFSELLV